MAAAPAEAKTFNNVPGSGGTNRVGWYFHPMPGLLLMVPVGFV